MTDDRSDSGRESAAARYQRVVRDLIDETRSLQELLDRVAPPQWDAPTPAVGWSVQDQVNHVAYFDEATVLAIQDPQRFSREAAELTAAKDDFPDRLVRSQRHLAPADSAAWFAKARNALLELTAGASAATRLPWYGPDMSITSAVTARLMETWAHGQDIADALGEARVATDRLRHIAHLGVATRAFSFHLRGLPPPATDIAVQLTAPSGVLWRWGDPGAIQRVTGTALDFCLVVTQRRHLADTTLYVVGDAATKWMSVAQAFAGVPGPGRQPLRRVVGASGSIGCAAAGGHPLYGELQRAPTADG